VKDKTKTKDEVSEEQAAAPPAEEEDTPSPVSEEQPTAAEEIDPTAALAAANARNEELQMKLMERDKAFAPLKEENARLAEQLAAAQEDAFASVAPTLREFAAAANPTIPAELIEGNIPDEIAASIEKARGIVEKITASAEENAAGVPAGAPGRKPLDTSGMSPAEKIAAGWQQRAGQTPSRQSSKVERP